MYRWTQLIKEDLRTKKVYKGKKRGTVTYIEPAFYDSETSKDIQVTDDIEQVVETWVYIWACQVGHRVYYGRDIVDFEKFLHALIKTYKTNRHNIMLIYIHNMPFDISYFWYILFKLDPALNCLALSPNKPFVCQCHEVGLEFRCSYRLANRSLDKWGKDLNIKQKKRTGMIDYSERHTPTEPLKEEQYIYLNYDIRSLKECFYKECELNGYDFHNVPLTSTGFVRRVFEREYHANYQKNRRKFLDTQVNADQYNRLIRAAAGGMSETGRHIIGRCIDGKIGHNDFDSFYPTQQAVDLYPMHPFTLYDAERGINKSRAIIRARLEKLLIDKWLVMDVLIKDLHIKKDVTCPFMMISKVYKETPTTEILHVNGKIVKVSGGCIRTCFTSDDYIVFRQQYDFKMRIIAIDSYTLAPLPDYVLDVVKRYYIGKNKLKEDYKQTPTEDNRINLMLQKAQLNAIFGCMYTRPVRSDIQINDNMQWTIKEKNTEQALQDYYDNVNSCLAFQWGVRTCSAARLQLFTAIQKIGYKNFLYCDTDSAFYIETAENKKALDEWNKQLQAESKAKGFFVEYNSKKKYFNYFDRENENIKSFKALHSKCYGYITDDDKLHITVAGVTRYGEIVKDNKIVQVSREDELQSLDRLKSGTIFKINGGTRATYNLHPLTQYKGINTAGGCAILDTTKELHEVYCNEQPICIWEVE